MPQLAASRFVVTDGLLGLRPFQEDDLSALYEIESDSHVKQYVGGGVKKQRADWIAAAATSVLSSDAQFAIECLSTGALVGRVTLGHFTAATTREVQIILARAFLGRGLGRTAFGLAVGHAFSSLGADSVAVAVDPNHSASLRLVEAFGMTETVPELDKNGQIAKRVFLLRKAA